MRRPVAYLGASAMPWMHLLISVFVALVKRDCVVARPRSQQEDGNTPVVGGLENDTYTGAAWVFTPGHRQ
jgi:hypothetical protein